MMTDEPSTAQEEFELWEDARCAFDEAILKFALTRKSFDRRYRERDGAVRMAYEDAMKLLREAEDGLRDLREVASDREDEAERRLEVKK